MQGSAKWGLAGLALGVGVALMLPTFAQTTSSGPDDARRTVGVIGEATISSAPDEAVVTLGVRTQAETAEEAMSENAGTMAAVLDAVRAEGIGSDDLATAWIELYPDRRHGRVVGYSAENQALVTIRDMGEIGRVIDRAVAAGANTTSGISFRLSDESRGEEQALEDAVADARRKAEVLAEAGGASLGAVVQVVETGATPLPAYPEYAMSLPLAAGRLATPVETPTLEREVTVSVTWELV